MVSVYFILWVALNGRLTGEVILLGVLISILLDLFVRRVLRIYPYGHRHVGPISLLSLLRLLPDALLCAALLVREVLKANLAVIRLILSPSIEVEPCLVRLRTSLKTEAARVALANSITLTPGTLTVDLDGDELLVHALNREMARGLAGSRLECVLAKMEAEPHA